MRALTIIFCVTAGLVMALTTAARAVIIVQDDFSGAAGTPDTAKWAAPSDYPGLLVGYDEASLDGSGHADVNSVGSPVVLTAKPSFLSSPTAGLPLMLTMTVANATSHLSFGLSDSNGSRIQLREDGLFGAVPEGHWGVYLSSDPTFAIYDALDTGISATAGTWVFTWTPTQVTILFNNTPVFDSANVSYAPTHDGGPTGWQIPTAAMVPLAYTYNPGVGLVDNVVFETVPEPASTALLLLGATALLGRRRRA